MKQKHHTTFYILTVIIIVIFFLSLKFGYIDKLDLSPSKIKDELLEFGIFAPLILIAIQFLLAIISILPSALFVIAGGYLFGPFFGTLYSLIGMLIGSLVVFSIAKRFGRNFVERFVDKRELHHFDLFFKKKGKLVFIFASYLSIFPRDTISLCAGLTKIKKLEFIMISIMAFIPHLLILTYFGSQLSKNIFDYRIILAGIIIIVSLILYYFRHKIKGLIVKEIKIFEEEYKKKKFF
ncbi:MAG: TVP38/TMEM64 family protein [Nanoarchaeota archaeon]|nr:TVP38/TMEM64 family protein [Nanoarchaeota archaeon]